jgi:hypothetical protein
MAGGQHLSRGGALAVGLACVTAGAMPILISLGVVHGACSAPKSSVRLQPD